MVAWPYEDWLIGAEGRPFCSNRGKGNMSFSPLFLRCVMKISKKEMLKFMLISTMVKKMPSARERVLATANSHLENTQASYRLGLSAKNNLVLLYEGEVRLDFGGKIKNWNEKIKDIPG